MPNLTKLCFSLCRVADRCQDGTLERALSFLEKGSSGLCWCRTTSPCHSFLFQEYQPCNTNPCPELKKTTPWTPWTPVNISDNGGHYEQRFRYTCKARLPDPNLLEVGRQRIEMRYCSSDGTSGCSTDGERRPPCPCPGLTHFHRQASIPSLRSQESKGMFSF